MHTHTHTLWEQTGTLVTQRRYPAHRTAGAVSRHLVAHFSVTAMSAFPGALIAPVGATATCNMTSVQYDVTLSLAFLSLQCTHCPSNMTSYRVMTSPCHTPLRHCNVRSLCGTHCPSRRHCNLSHDFMHYDHLNVNIHFWISISHAVLWLTQFAVCFCTLCLRIFFIRRNFLK